MQDRRSLLEGMALRGVDNFVPVLLTLSGHETSHLPVLVGSACLPGLLRLLLRYPHPRSGLAPLIPNHHSFPFLPIPPPPPLPAHLACVALAPPCGHAWASSHPIRGHECQTQEAQLFFVWIRSPGSFSRPRLLRRQKPARTLGRFSLSSLTGRDWSC